MKFKALISFLLAFAVAPPTIVLLGYASGTTTLRNWGAETDMALPTAISLEIMGVCVWLMLVVYYRKK